MTLNKDLGEAYMQNLHDRWIQPELDKRFGVFNIPDNFRIKQCLIKFPKDKAPIVQFNEEFGWYASMPEMSAGRSLAEMEFGEPVYLTDIINVGAILPPTVDNERVSFAFLYREKDTYSVYFDYIPNDPDYDPDDERFRFDGSVIAAYLQRSILRRVVQWAKTHEAMLSKIGLWVATPLFPYPLSKIIECIEKQNLEQAREVLVQHCNTEFIASKLVGTWHHIRIFKERHEFFDDALFLHKEGRYHGSISTLISQLEGVIVDWLYSMKPVEEVTWKTSSRIAQFRDLLLTIPDFDDAYHIALESTISLLQEEEATAKPFQKFKNWLDKTDPNFPSRHAVAHGKYVPEIYTEENSIKLFLLLDTICQFMIFYELQVLGRNLGQD